MITDNPLNDAIDYINSCDAYKGEEVLRTCWECNTEFIEVVFIESPSKFEGHYYCEDCLKELKK